MAPPDVYPNCHHRAPNSQPNTPLSQRPCSTAAMLHVTFFQTVRVILLLTRQSSNAFNLDSGSIKVLNLIMSFHLLSLEPLHMEFGLCLHNNPFISQAAAFVDQYPEAIPCVGWGLCSYRMISKVKSRVFVSIRLV